MNTLSFREYVLSHSPEDSPEGDFIMDAKHPASKEIPEVRKWSEVQEWLELQGASQPAIDAAKLVWKRYLRAKDAIPVQLGTGLTVAQLIELLKRESPDAHVIKYHPQGKITASRVLGFSKVSIKNGGRVIAAIMLE